MLKESGSVVSEDTGRGAGGAATASAAWPAQCCSKRRLEPRSPQMAAVPCPGAVEARNASLTLKNKQEPRSTASPDPPGSCPSGMCAWCYVWADGTGRAPGRGLGLVSTPAQSLLLHRPEALKEPDCAWEVSEHSSMR